MKVTINEKTGEVTITGKIGEDGGPFESKSKKSVLLLSTAGTAGAGVTFKGHAVSYNLNVMIPNPANAPAESEKAPKQKVSP